MFKLENQMNWCFCMGNDARRILDEGTYLMSIKYSNCRVNLYALGSKFYEIFYDPDSHEVEWINIAEGGDLTKYLKRI